ncbi:MAG: helix-turn-helix domain-containing protein [Anaerohalosphaeraceae bacterium]
MAGKYYTLQEVMEKLGKSEEQVKALVKEGTLRQYLDKGQALFDQTQVDALAADQQGLLDLTAAGTDFDLKLEETAEIKLLPDEEETPETPKKESEGGFGLSMAGEENLSSEDTRATSMGINVLDESDEGYKLAADTKGETRAGELEEIESLDADANLESVGSGSGLLDLSLQADDTSLGAVLDDILPAAAEGAAEAPLAEEPLKLAEEAPLEEVSEEAKTPQAVSAAEAASLESVTAPSGAAVQLAAAAPVDPATTAYGLAMLVPFASLIIAAIALGAGLRHIRPGLLNLLAGSQLMGVSMAWWIAGGLFVLTLLLLAVFNSMLSEKPPKPAGIAQKPKKEKAPKPEKKKKK